jgi:membrane fusion protein
MPPLFRPEALQAQQTAWLGSVRIVRPPSLTWLTAGVVVVALAIAAFLSLAHYTRKATLAGVLSPEGGVLRLLAPQAGVVLERRAAEGQVVQAGDVLYVLSIERPTLQRGAQAEVERSLDDRRRALQDTLRLQQSLSQTRVAALDRRLRALASEQAQLDAEVALQQRRLALGRESVARLETLQRDQFISPAQVQAKGEELLALQTQAQSL